MLRIDIKENFKIVQSSNGRILRDDYRINVILPPQKSRIGTVRYYIEFQ